MAVKISLKKNERKKYQYMVFAIVGVFLFFFGSSLLVKPEVDAKSTKIGEGVSSEMRSITLVERQYYPKDETLVFSYLSPINSSTVLDELKVSAKKDRTDETKYDASIKKINEELYVVKVKHLPNSWEKLAIAIYAKKSDLQSMGDDQKLHFVRQELTTNDPYNPNRSKSSYELTAVRFEIDQTQKDMRANSKKETDFHKSIKKIEKVNSNLELSLEDKTEKEQEKTKQTIDQNKSQIDSIEKEIATLKESDSELNLKLNKLNDRKQELQNP
ncbi:MULTISPECIES: hypothetical protein [unclassified Enterococcus]|uniref:hypothetical protein n=1 Tax=unclassified Enterococcus TaxID=2608891 RepID=UPI000A351864|nr:MULTISPECIES: hypothetical protein [unclassified Enterococcus]OTO77408.1 hypothetical protein A5865_001284 [Enterococcus sp. 12E11_DIV0728]OUZ16414.1 hypothetical protein A5868_001335 [Enterococcus sp. 12F9_DIV0723]